MRGPKHEEIERTIHGLTRQMDRVVLLGMQALKEIGTLSEGLETLRTDFTKRASRSLVQIVRERKAPKRADEVFAEPLDVEAIHVGATTEAPPLREDWP